MSEATKKVRQKNLSPAFGAVVGSGMRSRKDKSQDLG
jgi:hypothetical protein